MERDLHRLVPVDPGPGGHAAFLRVEHEHGRFEVDTIRFRLKLLREIPSPAFAIRREGSGFVLEGRGYGHGVGMCQFGANGLARDHHWSAARILAHYYPGTQLLQLWGARADSS